MIVFGLAALIAGLVAQHATTDEAKSKDTKPSSAFPTKPKSVTDPADVRRTIAGFDQHLAGFGQRVSRCDHVVRVQVGKDSRLYGRGLAAYGAYCTLGKGQAVALCYEEAVGRFALVADAFPIERAWIEAFTMSTCATFD